ncbi:MAG: hypothetical protein AAFX62_10170 [Pseudomonadota bacterium]
MTGMMRRTVSAAALAIWFVLPSGEAAAQRIACGGFYEVQAGDTLREIAVGAYGVGNFEAVFQANRDVLASPALLLVGQRLFIPCVDGSGPSTRQEFDGQQIGGQLEAPTLSASTLALPAPVPQPSEEELFGPEETVDPAPTATEIQPSQTQPVPTQPSRTQPSQTQLGQIQPSPTRSAQAQSGENDQRVAALSQGAVRRDSRPRIAVGSTEFVPQTDDQRQAVTVRGTGQLLQPGVATTVLVARGNAAGGIAGIQPAPASADTPAAPAQGTQVTGQRRGGGIAGIQPAQRAGRAGGGIAGIQPGASGAARTGAAAVAPATTGRAAGGIAGIQPGSPTGRASGRTASGASGRAVQAAAGQLGSDARSGDVPAQGVLIANPPSAAGSQSASARSGGAETQPVAGATVVNPPTNSASSDNTNSATSAAASALLQPERAEPSSDRDPGANAARSVSGPLALRLSPTTAPQPRQLPAPDQPVPRLALSLDLGLASPNERILPDEPAQEAPAETGAASAAEPAADGAAASADEPETALLNPSAGRATDAIVATAEPAVAETGQAPIRLLSGPYAPFAGDALPDQGMLSDVILRAIDRAAPGRATRVSFINDWSAHLTILLPDGAFDVGFPWLRPDCSNPALLNAALRSRCTDFVWSQPLHEMVIGYFVQNGGTYESVRDYDGLRGARICRPEGLPVFDLTQKGLTESTVGLVTGASAEACLSQLAAGEVDVVSLDVVVGEEAIDRLGLVGQLVELPDLADILTLHALSPRTNPAGRAYITLVNRGLRQMRESGEWYEVVARHLAGIAN